MSKGKLHLKYFFIDFIENRTRNGLSQKTALKTVKNILTEKNKHDCIMNVLEESHKKNPTVAALITVFRKVYAKKKYMTCQAITQKVTANLFNYKTNILKKFFLHFILKSFCSLFTVDSLFSHGE